MKPENTRPVSPEAGMPLLLHASAQRQVGICALKPLPGARPKPRPKLAMPDNWKRGHVGRARFSESRSLFGKPTVHNPASYAKHTDRRHSLGFTNASKFARSHLAPGRQPSACCRGLPPSPNSRPFARFASKPHHRGKIQKRSGFVRFCSLPLRSSLARLPASTVGLDARLRHTENMNLLPSNDLLIEQLSFALAVERSPLPASMVSPAPDVPAAGTGQRSVLSGFVRFCAAALR